MTKFVTRKLQNAFLYLSQRFLQILEFFAGKRPVKATNNAGCFRAFPLSFPLISLSSGP